MLDSAFVEILQRLAALEARLGQIQATESPGNGAANTILTSAGWLQLANAYVSTGAAISLSKLATTTAGLVRSNGTVMAGGATVVDADVDAAAAIALSKLAAGASGLVKSNGTAISAGNQLAAGDVPASLITTAMLGSNAATQMWSAALSGATTSAPYVAHGSISMTAAGALSLLVFSEVFTPSANQAPQWAYNVDGGTNVLVSMAPPTAANPNHVAAVVPLALSAGAHTINVVWGTSAGTLTSNGGNMVVVDFRR